MKKKLFALIGYAFFLLVFFFAARLVFLLGEYKNSAELGFRVLAGTFTHGIKLDISASAYIMAIPMLILIPSLWFRGEWFRHFMRIYTWLMLLISSLIIVGDSVLYSYWGFRMDYTPLLYLDNPGEAAASVTSLQIAGFALTVILLTAGFGWLYKRYIDRMFSDPGIIPYRIPATLVFMLLFGSLIIPIRGGVGLAPINAGTVYFSENLFANHSAVNVVWNVGSSWFNRKPSVNPYSFGDLEQSVAIRDSLAVKTDSVVYVLNTKRPNILLVIMESFGNFLVGSLGGDSATTPNLNRLSKEGLLFTNFYASGNRTDKALPAVLSGYPAQPAVSIIKEPRKTQSLTSLVKILNEEGYTSSFWYGGDINFANIKSYLISSGFRQIISMDHFSPDDYNSKWGVHDHVLFNTLRDSMAVMEGPFFRVVLTLSSHEPFDVPMEPVFEGKDDFAKFRNSVYYTDRSIGSFIDWAKTTEWWSNTLVVLVADHCRLSAPEDRVYSENVFRIPMLWLGGAIQNPGTRMNKTGSQVDFPLTLLNQMELDGQFPFSKDIFSEESGSFAFYVYNEGFGFITDSSKLIYDHKLGSPVVSEGSDPGNNERLGKAFLQVLYDDYMKR
ncbi:MAG: sulfatase-like hydrolase/transferase [Bacteroidales bacterium]|jgi:phosphoglycerol transferase MdoB-like AlkP superfamily enzyme|nr:sulfatase-like hydrolase/transferase [Bacteroidales bacterium]